MRIVRIGAAVIFFAPALGQPATGFPSTITSQTGVDATSGISYVLIAMTAKTGDAGTSAEHPPPRLIAQCSRTAAGKLKFELLAEEPEGGAGALSFQGPWIPRRDELFPPSLRKVQVAMEFVGYIKAKPVMRQWEYPFGSSGLLRYGTPGTSSRNLEEARFYMQYLRSLPTLRLTLPGKVTEEFDTSKWQAVVKAEPMCAASGL